MLAPTTATALPNEGGLRQRLVEFYLAVDIAKATPAHVDAVLAAYAGDWLALDEDLRERYQHSLNLLPQDSSSVGSAADPHSVHNYSSIDDGKGNKPLLGLCPTRPTCEECGGHQFAFLANGLSVEDFLLKGSISDLHRHQPQQQPTSETNRDTKSSTQLGVLHLSSLPLTTTATNPTSNGKTLQGWVEETAVVAPQLPPVRLLDEATVNHQDTPSAPIAGSLVDSHRHRSSSSSHPTTDSPSTPVAGGAGGVASRTASQLAAERSIMDQMAMSSKSDGAKNHHLKQRRMLA